MRRVIPPRAAFAGAVVCGLAATAPHAVTLPFFSFDVMIYATFTVWLLGAMFLALGVYRLWARLVRPVAVAWALLPGTLVYEMGYILGCLVTGAEVRRAKLMPNGKDAGEPTTEATTGIKFVSPMVAALLAIVACIGAILAVHAALGEPVIAAFTTGGGMLPAKTLPTALPDGWGELWTQLHTHLDLLRRMGETLAEVDWFDWRVPLFVYLSLCLAVRLSPGRRPIRPALAAAAAFAVVIALIGLIWPRFSSLMQDLWPLLTYIWALLLFLLAATLTAWGLASLVNILSGKTASAKPARARRTAVAVEE